MPIFGKKKQPGPISNQFFFEKKKNSTKNGLMRFELDGHMGVGWGGSGTSLNHKMDTAPHNKH